MNCTYPNFRMCNTMMTINKRYVVSIFSVQQSTHGLQINRQMLQKIIFLILISQKYLQLRLLLNPICAKAMKQLSYKTESKNIVHTTAKQKKLEIFQLGSQHLAVQQILSLCKSFIFHPINVIFGLILSFIYICNIVFYP